MKILGSALAAGVLALTMGFSASTAHADEALDAAMDATANAENLEAFDMNAFDAQSNAQPDAQLLDAQFRPGPGWGGGHGGPGGPGHGGGGWGGGHGGGHGGGDRRPVVCYAYNWRGQEFRGIGWSMREALYNAEDNCYRAGSRRCHASPRDCR